MAEAQEKFSPMTDEQRARWKETGLFPIELWRTGPDATPLMCPMPDRALLRSLAEAIPEHIQSSGWYATGQRYESRTVHSVYGDNFRGMGRQAIASVISVGSYSGPLAEYIAAACPRTVLRLLDRIKELEAAASPPSTAPSGMAQAAGEGQQAAGELLEMIEGHQYGLRGFGDGSLSRGRNLTDNERWIIRKALALYAASPAVAPSAQPVRMLTRAEVDEIVYQCRQDGDDTTYAIVHAALVSAIGAAPSAQEPQSACESEAECQWHPAHDHMLQLLREAQSGEFDSSARAHQDWLARVDAAIAKATRKENT